MDYPCGITRQVLEEGDPTPETITYEQACRLKDEYADLYPKLLHSDAKSKKALDDETWRYEQFPAVLKDRKASGAAVEFGELERLVQWKIKHGKNRPFLIGLIRKNDAAMVKAVTQDTFAKLPAMPSLSDVTVALKALNTIKGVGPATGSLVLSVYTPDLIPFFEDELYTWLCKDSDEVDAKLKYTVKEYGELWNSFDKLNQRLEKTGDKAVPAWILEQAAYVIQHRNQHRKESGIKPALTNEATPKNRTITSKAARKDPDKTIESDKVEFSPPVKKRKLDTAKETTSQTTRRTRQSRG